MIQDRAGDKTSVATMDMAIGMKTIERYEREEDGWPVLVFEDGASLKFVCDEIDVIPVYSHPHERRFTTTSP